MIRCTRHRADPVVSSRESALDSSREQTVAVACIVDTLKEDEFLGVQGRGGDEGAAHRLNCDVGVADDFATLEGLGSAIVAGWIVSLVYFCCWRPMRE